MRLRNITPKSLFGRMLAIILVPIILVQIISVSIFYERHWDWVSRHMSKNLAKDLGLLIDELGNEPSKDNSSCLKPEPLVILIMTVSKSVLIQLLGNFSIKPIL